jgi:hypothetical protein
VLVASNYSLRDEQATGVTRFYGPLEPWIDRRWKPDDIVPVN